MAVVAFRFLSVLVATIALLLVFEDWLSTPTCTTTNPLQHHPPLQTLNAMIVADLLLESHHGFAVKHLFRDYYMSKFFRKSFQKFNPDLLLVLGDVSARGYELTRASWVSVLRRFYRVLGPFVRVPFHAVLGDRDVGECGDVERVSWVASKLPGLDDCGCGVFEIGNVSFVTLNGVALLCGDAELRFEVERVVERESLELRVAHGEDVMPGLGPVVLLHLPLDRTGFEDCGGVADFKGFSKSFKDGFNVVPKTREAIGDGLHGLLHTLPLNASEYILQALKPRIIFSAHRHEFSEYVHRDKTREITVPTMSWNARDDPGFVIATFQKEGRAVSISYCSLARESHILLIYISILFLFCLACLKG